MTIWSGSITVVGQEGEEREGGGLETEWVAEGEIKRKDVHLIHVVPGREKLAGEILDQLGVMAGPGLGEVAESSYVLLQLVFVEEWLTGETPDQWGVEAGPGW